MPTSYYIISIHVNCISRMHKGWIVLDDSTYFSSYTILII